MRGQQSGARWLRRDGALAALIAILALAATPACAARQLGPVQGATPQDPLAGNYARLSPEQQRLIDNYLERYNDLRSTNLDETAYDALTYSVRTTFQAVTHALLNSQLTDAEGNDLGTALSLVAAVDMVHGQIIGAGGDQQFRVYASLRRDAVATLETSQQFRRHRDNSFFHNDYPLNYRQNGVPSLQFSIAADGLRADIDVDYRSSAFPVVLFDGHLSVANSDVRAAGNYLGHVSRWQGLLAWWHSLFGFGTAADDIEEGNAANILSSINGEPRNSGDDTIQAAAQDFLEAWLVEQDVDEAMRYLAEPALNCVHGLDPDGGDAYAALRIFDSMERTLRAVPPVDSLDELASPQPIPNDAMRPVAHEYSNLFELVEVPPTLAAALICPGGDTSESARRVHKRGRNRGVSLSITGADGSGFDLFQLWGRNGGHWQLIAFHYDGYPTPESVLQLHPLGDEPETETTVPSVPADAAFTATAASFLNTWFIDHAYDELRPYYSPRCYACVEIFHPELPPAIDVEQAWAQLRVGIEEIAAAVTLEPAAAHHGARRQRRLHPP